MVFAIKIIFLNRFFTKRKVRLSNLKEKWQPILVESLDEVPDELPSLDSRDTLDFLLLWNYLQESIRDESKENLNTIARKLHLDLWAVRALGKRNFRDKLLAIQTLGWLREKMVWHELIELMKSGAPMISLSAARALIRTDREIVVRDFIELIVTRNDWSFSLVGKILREAGADTISGPMVKIARATDEKSLPKLLRFF